MPIKLDCEQVQPKLDVIGEVTLPKKGLRAGAAVSGARSDSNTSSAPVKLLRATRSLPLPLALAKKIEEAKLAKIDKLTPPPKVPLPARRARLRA